MDIPLNYIILDLMITLKENNKELIINKKTLIIYLKRIVSLFNFDKTVLEDMVFDFDFNNELSFFLSEYGEYFEMDEDNNIVSVYDISLDELNNLLEEETISNIYENDLIMDIHNVIHDNYSLLEILDIRINTNIYKLIYELECELEKEYVNLGYGDVFYDIDTNNERQRIKMLKTIINTMYINIDNNLNNIEYKNLHTYAKSMARKMNGEEKEILIHCEPTFDDAMLINNPMDRAIFFKEPSSNYVLDARLEMNNKKKKKVFSYNDIIKLNFYLTFLNLLDDEIKRTNNDELRDELIISKYELMYTIDEIYDLMNFNKKEEVLNINSDYSFIIPIVYFYAFEVLSYDDSEYMVHNTKQKDIMTYFFNIIKKLYIETYYKLTNNEMIVNKIKNSSFYGTNMISTELFNSFIPYKDNKKRIRRKHI